jgi:circadian clock protein KaiB
MTPKSERAILNTKNFCEEHLKGRYELEIVDLYQQPALAKEQQIIAAPTLIKSLPHPLRRLVGDLSEKERVLVGLALEPKDTEK